MVNRRCVGRELRVELVLLALGVGFLGCRAEPEARGRSDELPVASATQSPADAALAKPAIRAEREAPEEAAAVRAIFEAYREATRLGDGNAALALVSANTLARYEQARSLAVTGAGCQEAADTEPCRHNREAIRAASLGDRLLMAMLLLRLGAARLERMSAADLFVFGVGQGWIGRESVRQSELGELTLVADAATGLALSEGKPSGALWRFVKESGGWRIDLSSMMDFADGRLALLAKQRQLSPDALLDEILREMGPVEPVDPWALFRAPEGFTVLLPEPPLRSEQRAASGAVVSYRAQSLREGSFIAGYSELPATDLGSAADTLDNAVRGFVAGSDGKLVDAFALAGGTQREAIVELPQGQATVRFVIVGERLFQLVALTPAEPNAKLLEAFFASFAVETR